jgi:uncharacterized protein (DUF58 family)
MKHVIEVRRAGMAYIAVSIFFGVIAVNSTNNLLYLTTAALLGYMLASGIAGRRNIRNAAVSVSFPGEIYARIPCAVSVRVANRSRFVPIFLIEVTMEEDAPEDEEADGPERGLKEGMKEGRRKKSGKRPGEKTKKTPQKRGVFFPVIQPGQSETKTLFVTFGGRGRRTAGDAELSSVYPFNFFVRYWPSGIGDSARRVTVFPCPLRSAPELVFVRESRKKDGEREQRERSSEKILSEADIVGVRPYAEGDSMKRIHWKSSARTGKLKTRLYDEASSRNRLLIDLDRLVAGDVERGLSAAAHAIAESMKTGAPVGMLCRREFIPPAAGRAHKIGLLTRLALYHE